MTDRLPSMGETVQLGRVLRLTALGTVVILLFALPFPTLVNPGFRRGLLVLAVVVATVGWYGELRLPRLPWALTAALAVTVIATALSAWASAHPSTAFFGLWMSLAYSGIAVFAWRRLQREEARTTVVVVVGLGGFLLVTGTYLANVVGEYVTWTSLGMSMSDAPLRPANAGGLVPGPTWTGDYAILLAPLALLAAAFITVRGQRLIQAAIVVLAVATIVSGAVRALWVATLIVFVVVLIVWVWQHRSATVLRRPMSIAIALGLAAGTALLSFLVIARAGSIFRDVDEGRLSAFQAAIDIFGRDPILGAGPGTYATLRMGYPAEATWRLTLPDPHNGILVAMSDTGLAGLAALALVSLIIGTLLIRGLRGAGGAIALVACFGLAVVTLHRLADLVFILPGLMVAGILAIGIVIGGQPAPPIPTGWRRVAPGALVGIAVAMTLASVPNLVGAEQGLDSYRAAAAAWDAGDVQNAGDLGAAALTDAPDLVPAYQLMSMVAIREGRADDAIAFADQAADREPMAQNLVRLGAAFANAGRQAAVDTTLSAAVESMPADPVALLNGVVLASPQDAPTTLTRLLEAEPEIAAFGSSFDAISPPVFTESVESAHRTLLAAGATDSALRLALAAERRDLADATLSQVSGPSLEVGSLLTDGWFGDTDAWPALDSIALADPVLGDRAAYLLAIRSCRQHDAERWAEVIRIRVRGAPEVIMGVGPATEIAAGDPPVRYPSWVWGVAELSPAYPDPMWSIDRRDDVTCLTAR